MFGCNDFWDKKKEVKNKKKNGWKKDVFSKGRDKRKLVGPDFFFYWAHQNFISPKCGENKDEHKFWAFL